MPSDLIIYALVAAGLVFWLRSVLGTRHGDERERPNPFTQTPAEKKQQAADVPVSAPLDQLALTDTAPKIDLPRNVTFANEGVEKGVYDIFRIDRDFDLITFAQGAQDAFVIIVEAFAEGDRDTLKNLLEEKVYAAFDGALKQREANGEKVSTEIHAVRRVEFLEVRIDDNKTAYVTIRFVADETCVVRDSAGLILSGDPDRITEMNDIWTFARVLKSRDPRWLVHETRDGDVQEDSRTPVPDVVV